MRKIYDTAKVAFVACVLVAVLGWDFAVALWRTAVLGKSADDQMEGKL